MDGDEEFSLEDFLEQEDITPDDVGTWATRKHDILQRYAEIYGRIVGSGPKLKRYYIDGFAGRGIARKRETGEVIPGSPVVALSIQPPFDRYFFVELDTQRYQDLRTLIGPRDDVESIHDDANSVLPDDIFARVKYENFERALCFLDPFKLRALRWETVCAAGKSAVIDLLLHFPTMDANRTVLLRDITKVTAVAEEKMNAFFGSTSWRQAAYTMEGFLPIPGLRARKETIDKVIDEYRKRLRELARFKVVSKGIPMKNSRGNVIYHIIVASPSNAARELVKWMEKKYGTT